MRSVPRSWSTWRTSRVGRGQGAYGDYDPVPHAHMSRLQPTRPCAVPRRTCPLPQGTRGVRRSRCPLVLGGPLPHVHGSQGRRVDRSVAAVLPGLCGSGLSTTRGSGRRADGRGCSCRDRRTDNHLVSSIVRHFGLNGRQAESACRAGGITLNRNVVPTTQTVRGTQADCDSALPRSRRSACEATRCAKSRRYSPLSFKARPPVSSHPGRIKASHRSYSSVSTTRSARRALESGQPPFSTPLYPDIEL